MHDDDAPLGRVLGRREMLALVGASGLTLTGGAGWRRARGRSSVAPLPSCVVRPEQTEGPYFVDERLERSDIRTDPATGEVSAGAALSVVFLVSKVDAGACTPLPGVLVDVWHCDTRGIYSDVKDPAFDTVGQRFLRGYQVTDRDGRATFRTVYPGWYPGRAVHIHFKLRTPAGSPRAHEFTSQLYFDETLTDLVHAAGPYARAGARRRNEADGIFQRQGGTQLVMPVAATAEGYHGTFSVGLHMA